MTESIAERVAKAIYQKRNGAGCPPWSRLPAAHKAPYLDDASAAIEAMADDDAAKVFWQDWAARRLEISRRQWMQAAKAALDRGDMRGLRLRIDQIEAPPAQIVGSEAPTPTERESA